MTYEQLQKLVEDLNRRLKVVESRSNNSSNFEDGFGSRNVIKKDVQFMGKVYDKDGNIVTEINP